MQSPFHWSYETRLSLLAAPGAVSLGTVFAYARSLLTNAREILENFNCLLQIKLEFKFFNQAFNLYGKTQVLVVKAHETI